MSEGSLPRKAIVLLASIPEADATQLLSHFSDDELDQLLAVARDGVVPTPLEQDELTDDLTTRRQTAWASREPAKNGAEVPAEMCEELAADPHRVFSAEDTIRQKFCALARETPERIRSLLAHERSQTVALVLAFLPPAASAAVLGTLPTEVQVAASVRVARLDGVDIEAACEVADVLQLRARRRETPLEPEVGGPRHLARIIQATDQATQRALMENLTHEDHELVDELQQHLSLMRGLRCRQCA